MKIVRRNEVQKKSLPGRVLQLVVAKEGAASWSQSVTMGFARYSSESGRMEPHRHAEEVVLILGSESGWIRFGGLGDKPDGMCEPLPLEKGMVLHIPQSEWHAFGYDGDGYVDIAFFYGQGDVYSRKS